MSLKDYLSIEEAARIKGVSRQALYLAEKSGRLKIERIGRCALINKAELDKYSPNPDSMRAGRLPKKSKSKSKSGKTAAKKGSRQL
ncbi:MAG: helix-turn-helix domain-containing protein [Blastocatellia bacterium]